MTNENELIQRLMVSKKIMEKHGEMPRNGVQGNVLTAPMVEDYSAPTTNYNLPSDMLQESNIPMNPMPQSSSKERIMSSKLPDEIKMLMIEHPINQPDSMTGPSLSNDLVEKASRLMNTGTKSTQTKQQPQTQQQSSSVDMKMMRQMMREVVEEVLSENGLLTESTSKSNETISFKVGKHIFEGKVTKIRKVQ
jgi:hypothetical protein